MPENESKHLKMDCANTPPKKLGGNAAIQGATGLCKHMEGLCSEAFGIKRVDGDCGVVTFVRARSRPGGMLSHLKVLWPMDTNRATPATPIIIQKYSVLATRVDCCCSVCASIAVEISPA